jgi:adenosylcobinamide-phosphate synthase
MAHKVHLSKNRSPYQQKISGWMATMMLILPVITMLALVIQFAEFPIFFDGLLLFISIYFHPQLKRIKNTYNGLISEKKVLVRHQLQEVCLRETNNLSSLGITKAAIEATVLRFIYQVITPLFWFMVFGGVGAITYRLIYELNQEWNQKRVVNQSFGRPIGLIYTFISWIPTQLALITLCFAENLSAGLSAWITHLNKKPRHQIIAVASSALKIELGGPVIYDNRKYRFFKFHGRTPQALDIKRAYIMIDKMLVIWLVLSGLVSAVLFAFSAGSLA